MAGLGSLGSSIIYAHLTMWRIPRPLSSADPFLAFDAFYIQSTKMCGIAGYILFFPFLSSNSASVILVFVCQSARYSTSVAIRVDISNPPADIRGTLQDIGISGLAEISSNYECCVFDVVIECVINSRASIIHRCQPTSPRNCRSFRLFTTIAPRTCPQHLPLESEMSDPSLENLWERISETLPRCRHLEINVRPELILCLRLQTPIPHLNYLCVSSTIGVRVTILHTFFKSSFNVSDKPLARTHCRIIYRA